MLSSWRDGSAKQAIVDFVTSATREGPIFVPAALADLQIIEAERFDVYALHPTSVAVYSVSNDGTARKRLRAWAPPA